MTIVVGCPLGAGSEVPSWLWACKKPRVKIPEVDTGARINWNDMSERPRPVRSGTDVCHCAETKQLSRNIPDTRPARPTSRQMEENTLEEHV